MIKTVRLLPLHICQFHRAAIVRNALGDKGYICVRQVRVTSYRRYSLGGSVIACGFYLDAGGIQHQSPSVTILCGNGALRSQPGHDRLHVLCVRVQRVGFCIVLRIALGVLLPGHIQQCVVPALPVKISDGDAGRVICGRQKIGALQPHFFSTGVLVDLCGIKRWCQEQRIRC